MNKRRQQRRRTHTLHSSNHNKIIINNIYYIHAIQQSIEIESMHTFDVCTHTQARKHRHRHSSPRKIRFVRTRTVIGILEFNAIVYALFILCTTNPETYRFIQRQSVREKESACLRVQRKMYLLSLVHLIPKVSALFEETLKIDFIYTPIVDALSRSMCTIIASIKSNGAFTQSDYTVWVCARAYVYIAQLWIKL